MTRSWFCSMLRAHQDKRGDLVSLHDGFNLQIRKVSLVKVIM